MADTTELETQINNAITHLATQISEGRSSSSTAALQWAQAIEALAKASAITQNPSRYASAVSH